MIGAANRAMSRATEPGSPTNGSPPMPLDWLSRMCWNSSGECILRRDVPHRQNVVDGRPIGIVDDGMW
jgi:hypothetical protein